MNWLSNFIRPKVRTETTPSAIPDNLWDKCPQCEQMLFHRDLVDNLHVCHHCDHHLRVGARQRLDMLCDGVYQMIPVPKVAQDPLKFKDLKKYTDRLKTARTSPDTPDDAVIPVVGHIHGLQCVFIAFDFNFMGGSMGMYVGEAFVAAAHQARTLKCPMVVISSSGGARMQEGILSLMQMARTTVAVKLVKEAGLPFIVVLTDPTTGGVSASFAMLGDIAIAEPKALIGFTGARVIEETIRTKLPDGFQRAEYLLEKGMIDMIVHRKDLKNTLAQVLSLLLKAPPIKHYTR